MATDFDDNETVLVSANAQGQEGNGFSFDPSLSNSGRYVAFHSEASNLVPGDTNGAQDVFVKDVRTGAVTLASADAQGNEGNGGSNSASISGNGHIVAFNSGASNLVPGDTNGFEDIFVKDLRSGAITLASADAHGNEGNSFSFSPSLSGNGHFVAFTSLASNLVPGDTNGNFDVFVKNLRTRDVTLVSADAHGNVGNNSSSGGSISEDGRYVAFDSLSSNLVPGDTNGNFDVFVKDLRTGELTLASTDAHGNEGNGFSAAPSISADGRYVAFQSDASNLVPGDTNGTTDIFVKDLRTGAVALVSTDTQGNEGNGSSSNAHISPDGRYVAFTSDSSNFAPNDTNGTFDVFVKDLRTGELTLVSDVGQGQTANGFSEGGPVTNDGTVAYFSFASNLVANDTNDVSDVFLWTSHGLGSHMDDMFLG